ncbi:hypothetical protein BJF78_03625 [Pseudonocardia sp. CNS-139]|nr:hypothetical protein BJF78_03625 [Pseudonocardia sp. CNS-139]
MRSSSVISASAAARGVPPTAAVGCTAAASASSGAGAAGSSVPRTSLARCETFGSASTDGLSGTSRSRQNGRRVSASESTASACSWRSLAEPRSCPDRSSPRPGQIVPASTRDETVPASRRTSSSGVAPTSPSTAYDQQVG